MVIRATVFLWREVETIKMMRLFALAAIFWFWIVCWPAPAHAQEVSPNSAGRLAHTVIQRWPQGEPLQTGAPVRWNYELGTLLNGMDALWYETADADYYRYLKQIDLFDRPVAKLIQLQSEAVAILRGTLYQCTAFQHHERTVSGALMQTHALAYFGKAERRVTFTQHLQNGDGPIQTMQLVPIPGSGYGFRNRRSV
jgi:hypothetical protein